MHYALGGDRQNDSASLLDGFTNDSVKLGQKVARILTHRCTDLGRGASMDIIDCPCATHGGARSTVVVSGPPCGNLIILQTVLR